MSFDINEFKVDLKCINQNRKKGISGILRVKNDAEFLQICIESCIDALDELIIVYNDCSDNSPQLLKNIAQKYSNKIKLYNYLPHIKSHALTENEYLNLKNNHIDSIHLLSNYYNYALSKTSYEYVMKIDADQIYYTNELKRICNYYRTERKFSIPTIREFTSFIYFYYRLRKNKKGCSNRLYQQYKSCLEKFIQLFKISISLSGINLVHDTNKWLVPLGRITGKLNILPPYNGVGDHLIFKVTEDTYFVPYDCVEYNKLTSNNYTFIERLVGVKRSFPYGFIWWHFNGIRRNIYYEQQNNISRFNNSFLDIDKFTNVKFNEISDQISKDLLHPSTHALFEVYHNTFANEKELSNLKNLKYNLLDGLYFNENISK